MTLNKANKKDLEAAKVLLKESLLNLKTIQIPEAADRQNCFD